MPKKKVKNNFFLYLRFIGYTYFISAINLKNSLALISEPVFAKRQLFNDIYLALI